MVRTAIESLYVGRCTITQSVKTKNPITKRVEFSDEILCVDEPCRLSFMGSGNANQTKTVSIADQTIKLFLKPELVVLPGSKIEITQNGRTFQFISSGQPAVHSNHQEIVLRLEDDIA